MNLTFLVCLAAVLAPGAFVLLNRPRLAGLCAFLLWLASSDIMWRKPVTAGINLAVGVIVCSLVASVSAPTRRGGVTP